MSTTVSYKGNTIATLSNETKTLTTAGTWVEADIVVTDSGGTAAISVVDTTDSHGGTIREIAALDISDTTAIASDVATGKYFYTADGTKTEGTSSGGNSDTFADICNGTVTTYESTALTRIPTNTMRSIGLTSIKIPNCLDIGSYGLGGYQGTTIALPSFTGTVYSLGFAFSGSSVQIVDLGANAVRIYSGFFNGASSLNTLILRKTTDVVNLININAFAGTAFATGKAGGTLYVPNSLISTYESATNWSTILGYETNSIEAIEGSQYEDYYADGTPVS